MPTQKFQYRKILETLSRHGVEHIIVGGVCAVAHGAPITTFDLDVVHQQTPENIDRVLSALAELEAYHRKPGCRRIAPRRAVLESGSPALFTTKYGSLDFLGELSEERNFEALRAHAVELTLDSNLKIRILDLETLIDVKEKTGRPKDTAVLEILRQTLAERGRRQ